MPPHQHKLFYAAEPVDQLSKVVGCWKPGTFPRRYLSDVIELAHIQLKLLEANARRAKANRSKEEKKVEAVHMDCKYSQSLRAG